MDGRTDPAQPRPTRTARCLLWRRLLRPEPVRVRPHAHGQVWPEPAHAQARARPRARRLLRKEPARVRPRAGRLIRPEPASVRLARAQARTRPVTVVLPALVTHLLGFRATDLLDVLPGDLEVSSDVGNFVVDVSLMGSPAAVAAVAAAAAATPRHGTAVQTLRLPPLFWLSSSCGRGLFKSFLSAPLHMMCLRSTVWSLSL